MITLQAHIIDGPIKTPCQAIIEPSVDLCYRLKQVFLTMKDAKACSISIYNADISWFDQEHREILTELDKITVDEQGNILWHAAHRNRIVISSKIHLNEIRIASRQAA